MGPPAAWQLPLFPEAGYAYNSFTGVRRTYRGHGLAEAKLLAIRHMDEGENLVPGEEGFDLPEKLNVLPADPHIHKTCGNAFNKTDLAARLREQGVDTVVVTGFCAEYCVLSTYRGALDVDLTPVILRGSLASTRPESIRFVESISDIISYGALRKVLG